jgi:dihydromonapterin reductase/dihydrofolate reductase
MSTILITGSSRRLGLYLTQHFLHLNKVNKVIAITRKINSELKHLLKTNRLQVIEVDYADTSSIEKAIKDIKDDNEYINIMVHNASLYEKDNNNTDNLWKFYDNLYSVHMKMPVQLNEGLFTLISNKENPGSIIYITDIAAENPNENASLYSSTKAASENLCKSYAKKFAPHVRVNSIQPGSILFMPTHTEEHREKRAKQTLLEVNPGFLPILQGIEFITKNSFITGTSIKIDGGRSIYTP